MTPRLLCTLLLVAVTPMAARAARSIEHAQLAVGTGYHFSSGTYGESDATRIHYMPLIARGELDRLAAEITLPAMVLRGPSGIAGVVGGVDDGDIDTSGGLGDIQLAASYLQPPPSRAWPFVEGELRLKLPTASSSNGLGTGELDIIPSLQATWSLGRWSPFAGVAYEILGDPGESTADDGTVTGFELQNAVRVSAGTVWQAMESLSLGMSVEYGTPTADAAGDRLDLVPFAGWQFVPAWSLQVYATAGLADGSADAGAGLQLTHTWNLIPAPTENP